MGKWEGYHDVLQSMGSISYDVLQVNGKHLAKDIILCPVGRKQLDKKKKNPRHSRMSFGL